MDRRQQKTRKAIFDAFIELISEENYSKITIQQIIDKANIGRSTFYSHFQTKDELLQEMCKEIFEHILCVANDTNHTHNYTNQSNFPTSIICHILHHIKENDHNILTLFSSNENSFFLQYFKQNLNNLMYINFIQCRPKSNLLTQKDSSLPSEEFILNHISGSFVAMIQWWIQRGLKESPEQLDQWFSKTVIMGL